MRVNVISAMPPQFNSNLFITKNLFEELEFVKGVEKGDLTTVDEIESLKDGKSILSILIGSIFLREYFINFYISALKRKGHKVVLWLHDDPYEHDAIWLLSEEVDLIVTNEKEAVGEYHNCRNMALPLAASESYLRLKTRQTRNVDLSFVGYAYPNRRKFFVDFADYCKISDYHPSIGLYGDGWLLFETPNAADIRLSESGFAEISMRSKYSLYLGRAGYDLSNVFRSIAPTAPGPRFFQIAAMGCAQIVQGYEQQFSNYINHPEGVIYCSQPSDCAKIVRETQDNPKYWSKISEDLRAIVREKHLFRHRVEKILPLIN